MKKLSVLCAAILIASLFAMTSCGLFNLTYPDDSFPSEVATSQGKEGSPESYLASFETPTSEYRRAYLEAVEDGSFSGSYFEFLAQIAGGEDTPYVQRALMSSVSVISAFNEGRRDAFYVAGSGVIYDLDVSEGDAYVITNYHVVYGASSTGRESIPHISDDISVFLYASEVESRAIAATFVGGTSDYDIAVLRVEDSPLLKESAENPVYARAVIGADSDSVSAGERVYAIGNADDGGISVTQGIISVPYETITVNIKDAATNIPVMRTDADVNHGNSGGGLFSAAGELLGIVNARSEDEDLEGFGYAIPSNVALALAQNIIDAYKADPSVHGAAVARLGLTSKVVDSHSVYDEKLGKVYIEQQIAVASVTTGSLASSAGFKINDTFLSITLYPSSGTPRTVAVTSSIKVNTLLFCVRLGDRVEIEVSRDGETVTIPVAFSDVKNFVIMD